MDRTARPPVYLPVIALLALGCPGPSGLKPLPDGPPPEYEAPRTYDPEGKSIDGQPMETEGPDAPPPAPAPAVEDEEPKTPPTPPDEAPTPDPEEEQPES